MRKTLNILLPLLAFALWMTVFFPWFRQTEQDSFFCFLPVFHAPFFRSPRGIAEWTARFCIQFFHWDAGTIITMGLLFAVWMLLYRAAAGRIPLWAEWTAGALWPLVFFVFGYKGIKGLTLIVGLVFIAACLLLLACGIRFLTASRGRPAAAPDDFRAKHPHPAALFPVWMLWVIIPFVFPEFAVQRTFYRVERAAENGDWEKVYTLSAAYFDKTKEPYRDEKPPMETANPRAVYRDLLSVDFKLALIKTGRLNKEFFSYGQTPEMRSMFTYASTAAGRYNIPNVRTAWRLGLFVPMRVYLNNYLNTGELTFSSLCKVIPCNIFLARYDLAKNYLYYLSHTLAYKREADYWKKFNGEQAVWQEPSLAFYRQSGNPKMSEEGINLDFWVKAVYTPFSDRDLLEYRTFLCLVETSLGDLPTIAEHYRRLEVNVLPDYVQEALLLYQGYRPEAGAPQTYSGYSYSPLVLQQFARTEHSCRAWQAGRLNFETLREEYAGTYCFYFYVTQAQRMGL